MGDLICSPTTNNISLNVFFLFFGYSRDDTTPQLDRKVIELAAWLIPQHFNTLTQWLLSATKEPKNVPKDRKG